MIKKSLKYIFFCIIFIVVVIGLIKLLSAIAFIKAGLSDDRMSKKKIYDYIIQNQEVLENNINSFIMENPNKLKDIGYYLSIPKCDGIKHISTTKNMSYKETAIRFDCGGYGLGSATGYAGFYYLLSDEELGENMSALGYGGYHNSCKFVPDGDGWLYKQPDGDNTVYIENIVGKFYYYLEEY